MTDLNLAQIYRDYIACLNGQDWGSLGQFISEEVHHNGRRLGVIGYRAMLEKDYLEIPDLRFHIELLVVEPPRVASRLAFHCSPKGLFHSLPVNGKRVRFAENVFYEFEDGRIVDVRSIIDKAAIEAQI